MVLIGEVWLFAELILKQLANYFVVLAADATFAGLRFLVLDGLMAFLKAEAAPLLLHAELTGEVVCVSLADGAHLVAVLLVYFQDVRMVLLERAKHIFANALNLLEAADHIEERVFLLFAALISDANDALLLVGGILLAQRVEREGLLEDEHGTHVLDAFDDLTQALGLLLRRHSLEVLYNRLLDALDDLVVDGVGEGELCLLDALHLGVFEFAKLKHVFQLVDFGLGVYVEGQQHELANLVASLTVGVVFVEVFAGGL